MYYDINNLAQYTELLKTPPKNWEHHMGQWLSKELHKISETMASLQTIAYPASDSIDFDLWEKLERNNRKLIISEVCADPNLRNDFLNRLKKLEEEKNNLKQLRAKGLCFRLKNRKLFSDKKKEIKDLQTFYFPYLASVACSFYVEQGLGNEADAISCLLR